MKTINLILIMLPCILFNCCKPHNEPIPDPPTENIENVYLVDVVDDKDYNGVIDVFYGNPFSSKVSIGTNTENIDLKLVKRFYKFTMDEEYFGSLIPVDDTAMAESLIMQYGGTPIKTE